MTKLNEIAEEYSKWDKIITSVSSPLKFFTLVALICHIVFAICASVIGEPMLLVYCMHMFIALIAFIFVTSIWCPIALYHPSEINGSYFEQIKHNPWIPSILGLIGLVLYLVYQIIIIFSGGHPYIKPTHPHVIQQMLFDSKIEKTGNNPKQAHKLTFIQGQEDRYTFSVSR